MGFITLLALVYTHMQMQIIELAYRGKAKEKQIRKLIENNSHLTSAILALKSSNNLGDKLLADQNQMQFLAQVLKHLLLLIINSDLPVTI